MVALRARLGTHECGNLLFLGHCSRVVFIFDALLELILGTTKLCLTLLLLIILHLLHELRRDTHECFVNLLWRRGLGRRML